MKSRLIKFNVGKKIRSDSWNNLGKELKIPLRDAGGHKIDSHLRAQVYSLLI
jgi:hypothetical protein